MRKTKPADLHQIRSKDCPKFKFFFSRCELPICKKHLKLKLKASGDDWNHGSELDLIDGIDRSLGGSTTETENTVMIENESFSPEEIIPKHERRLVESSSEATAVANENEEEEDVIDAIIADIEYEESCKKVHQWIERNEELEMTNKGTFNDFMLD